MSRMADLHALLINMAAELEIWAEEPEIAVHPIYPQLVALRKCHDRTAAEIGDTRELEE